jgi:hypothetical protein
MQNKVLGKKTPKIMIQQGAAIGYKENKTNKKLQFWNGRSKIAVFCRLNDKI